MTTFKLLAIACALTLSACGGSGSSEPRQLAEVPVAGTFNFDLGVVDATASRYYQADAGNNQIVVFDTNTNMQIGKLGAGAFNGNKTAPGSNDHSHNGPDGLVLIPGTTTLYAGDVNSVKILDTVSGAVIKSIPISSNGLRVDEGCYDPDDGIVMFSSPEETPPFVSFISTKTQTLMGKYVFSADSAGLEQCVYDSKTKSFLINNDGTTANPDGELDVITAASVMANAPLVSKAYALPACGPGGLVLGQNNEVLVGCNPMPPATKQVSLILDKTNGNIIATIPFGGADAVGYDPVTNRYFVPAFFHQANNVPGNPANASPTLGIFDGATKVSIAQLPTGNGAHAIAIDSSTHKVFVPHLSGAPGSAFAVPGVSIFSTN